MTIFGKRASTLDVERDRVRAARHDAREKLDASFAHLFAMMDETLAELRGEPQLIEDHSKDDQEAKARNNGRNKQS